MSFPASPTSGQQATEGGRLYEWDGYAWSLVANVSGHAASHAAGGGDSITLAASQLSGGAMPAGAKLTLSEGPYDSEVGGWGFGVQLSANNATNAFIDASGFTVQAAGKSMQMTATGLGFPDATTQATAFTGSLAAASVTGLAPLATSGSASDLTSGTLPDARLSTNVMLASAFAATTNQSTSFIEPIDRQALTTAQGLVNTAQYWTFFTPAYSLTITQIAYACATAASGLTLCRFGLYTMSAAGAGTLVARTANDTSCFNASNTIFTRNLDSTGGYVSSYALQAGQRYAVSVAVAGTGGMGSLAGSACPNYLAGLTPRVQGVRTGVSDLLTSQGSSQYSGSVAHIYWARLS